MNKEAVAVKSLQDIQIDWRRTKNKVDLLRHAYNQGRTVDEFQQTIHISSNHCHSWQLLL